jgi:archaellum component FlaC
MNKAAKTTDSKKNKINIPYEQIKTQSSNTNSEIEGLHSHIKDVTYAR